MIDQRGCSRRQVRWAATRLHLLSFIPLPLLGGINVALQRSQRGTGEASNIDTQSSASTTIRHTPPKPTLPPLPRCRRSTVSPASRRHRTAAPNPPLLSLPLLAPAFPLRRRFPETTATISTRRARAAAAIEHPSRSTADPHTSLSAPPDRARVSPPPSAMRVATT